ncbi:PAS domain-containing protein, partial [Mycobacterium tuberculosis]|nr:PAS domain-containing protein [Mycobacterium tuberculosis]
FNSTPIAITALDRDGRIGRSNAPFLKLFGDLVRSEGGRVRLVDLVIESDRPKLVEAISAAARGQGTIPPVDVQIAGDQPKQRYVRFFVSSVEDDAGDGEAAVVYGLETTQQRELEQQFAQSQKMQG